MSKAATILAAVAVILAAAALVVALNARTQAERNAEMQDLFTDTTAELRGEVVRLEGELDNATRSLRAARDANREREEELSALAIRVGAVEKRAVSPTAGPAVSAAAAEEKAGEDAAAAAARLEEFKRLAARFFNEDMSAEDQERYWELVRNTDVEDEWVKEMEKVVEQRQNDIDARMELSEAYVAKLLSVPAGPEMGVWGSKAENQWREVLKLDENHWDARFSIAFSYSQYPEFMNKTPDSIKEFETLREIQERGAPEDKHSSTYVQLSQLYMRQGNTEKARETLENGLRRHPGDDGMTKALETMGE